MALKDSFPEAGSDYMGGESDGFIYRTVFAGTSLKHSYEMVRTFLTDEGFLIPLPEDAAELKKFRLATRNRQIILFEDNGYVHNPVKILFPPDSRNKRTLILEIYNERADQHLLRFHRRLE